MIEMCSDGKQCYRHIGDELEEITPTEVDELLKLYAKDREMALTSIGGPVREVGLIEKRKNRNIASDGSLLGDYVR